jgi:putative transposase
MVYQFIQDQSMSYPVALLCKTMQISRSAYYDFRAGHTFQPSPDRLQMSAQVKEVFGAHRRRYGSRRVMVTLQRQGMRIGRYQVSSLMRAQNLIAIQPKSFVPKTTNSKHTLGYSPNVLAQRGFPTGIGQVYVGDITYLPTTNGDWLYLMVWMDLFCRRICGWKVEEHMEESLVIESLQQAFYKRPPTPGLIAHSDRGGQFASVNYRALLLKHDCVQSMSEADNPYDNAFAESFFSRFKAELLQKGAFESKQDAQAELFDFIEMYYNTHRLHSSLGYRSPMEYEASLLPLK